MTRITIAGLFFLLLVVVGCNGVEVKKEDYNLDGGSCKYVDIPGVAVITAIREPDPGDYNCRQAVAVFFDFLPDDTAAVSRYRFPDRPDATHRLTVGAGMNPPRKWIEGQGIVVGGKLRCLRSEIFSGSCTPVSFSFPDLDWSGWQKMCW